MKTGLRLFFIFALLVPAGPINGFVHKPPADCPICGHVCCCPEMCALKLKGMRSCANDLSTCKISRKDGRAAVNLNDTATRPAQDPRIIPDALHFVNLRHEKVLEEELLRPLSPIAKIQTPPPRLGA